MFKVINWDTDEIITSAQKLSTARRLCRKQGHTGASNGEYFSPVALVRDAGGYCIYNPVFRVGKHDHLKAETFIIAKSDDGGLWQLVDTRGSLAVANTLAKNTVAPVVAVFTKAQWGKEGATPRFLHDNRDKINTHIRGVGGLVNSVPSSYF